MMPRDALIFAAPPPRRPVGTSRRDAYRDPRPRKLDVERLGVIGHLSAQGWTLCEIAAEVGVSHETVRTAIRRANRMDD